MNTLQSVPTPDLVDELRNREGVQVILAEPYEDINVVSNGPAIVLVVDD